MSFSHIWLILVLQRSFFLFIKHCSPTFVNTAAVHIIFRPLSLIYGLWAAQEGPLGCFKIVIILAVAKLSMYNWVVCEYHGPVHVLGKWTLATEGVCVLSPLSSLSQKPLEWKIHAGIFLQTATNDTCPARLKCNSFHPTTFWKCTFWQCSAAVSWPRADICPLGAIWGDYLIQYQFVLQPILYQLYHILCCTTFHSPCYTLLLTSFMSRHVKDWDATQGSVMAFRIDRY